jgi:hypothetical protein
MANGVIALYPSSARRVSFIGFPAPLLLGTVSK